MADEHPALAAARAHALSCTRCPELAASRTQVVWGTGAEDADVLVVGAAPGAGEDALGRPLVGQARELLDRLLSASGLPADRVFSTGLVKCLPPSGRDPTPGEVANCSGHLVAQVELLRPVVVVALGDAVTKLLRGDHAALRERRGREEARALGGLAVWLLPVYHPGAALYAPALTEELALDLARLPELVARGRPELEAPGRPEPEREPVAGPGQLGLF